MTGARRRGDSIRRFILNNLNSHPRDIVAVTAGQFGVSRQAINKHMKVLVASNLIKVLGVTRDRTYMLAPLDGKRIRFSLLGGIEEDEIWRRCVASFSSDLPSNVMDIWNYCFTEMANNAADHSKGTSGVVSVELNKVNTEITIIDDGEGIFRKIQKEFDLLDERQAIFELSKGKLTTDPTNHSGEGIFFTSRMVDLFRITSGGAIFSRDKETGFKSIFKEQSIQGTIVFMKMRNDVTRTTEEIFDLYADPENGDYGFNKTIISVRLACYDNDMLVSRSQAKRLLSRVDRFKTVILDFQGIGAIGQAFADEIFRVFVNRTPGTRITPINMTEAVQKMVIRAL